MNGQYREALQRAQWYMAQGTHSQLAEAFLQADRWKQERDALQLRGEGLEAALRRYADEKNWRCLRCERSDDGSHRAEHDHDVWDGPKDGPELAKSALEGLV